MNDQLDSVCERIFECKRCTFWREVQSLGLDYRPELPDMSGDLSLSDFKILSVGINPGWAQRWDDAYEELRPLYRIADFREYRDKLRAWGDGKAYGPGPYERGVAKTVNCFNEHLGFLDGPLHPANVWRSVFWTNLSMCASQTPHKRSFGGQAVPCDVMGEEISNCLDAGFSAELYNLIKPRLVLLFAASVTSFISPSSIVRRIVHGPGSTEPVHVEPFSLPAFARSDGGVTNAHFAAAFVSGTTFAFVPHPNFPITDENREAAISAVCKWVTPFLPNASR